MRSINRSQRNHNVLKQKQKLIGGEINIEICPFPTKINVNQSDANLHFACSVSPVAWELSFWVRVSDRGTYLQLARFVNELYCRPSALSRVSPELRAVRDWCAAADMIHCPASGGWCCLACFVGGSEALSTKHNWESYQFDSLCYVRALAYRIILRSHLLIYHHPLLSNGGLLNALRTRLRSNVDQQVARQCDDVRCLRLKESQNIIFCCLCR